MDGYLTTEQVAAELGVSTRRVQALIAAGRLPASKVGTGNRATYFIAPFNLKLVKHRKPGRPKGSKSRAK
jgi:excisionase family DNA binding protein